MASHIINDSSLAWLFITTSSSIVWLYFDLFSQVPTCGIFRPFAIWSYFLNNVSKHILEVELVSHKACNNLRLLRLILMVVLYFHVQRVSLHKWDVLSEETLSGTRPYW